MPSKKEHLRKADEDEQFVAALDSSQSYNLPWAITAMFYAALHHVEGYFAGLGVHSADHRTRDSSIRRDPKLKRIYRHYSELKNFSINARYYMVRFSEADLASLWPHLKAIRTHLSQYND